jgi:signal peptidase I
MRFEEILVLLTVLTGVICLANFIYQKKNNKQTSGKQNWAIEYSRSFFPVFLIVLLLRSFLIEPFRIPSGSMKPTLLEGDLIVVNKFVYGLRLPVFGTKLVEFSKPKAGDIIVFHHKDGKDLIKRVVGIPGDHIRYADEQLYINGKAVDTKFMQTSQDGTVPVLESSERLNDVVHSIYVNPHRFVNYPFKDVIVPANSYFVLGDNRGNSEDGRFWGFVPEQNIMGKAFATWLSWDSVHHDVRWSRFGRSMYKYVDERS